MKKIKLLTPILGVTALASTVAPIATITSCSNGSTPTVEASISIGIDKFDLELGKSVQLKANVTGTSKEVTWSTSDESVATVTGGLVYGAKAGVATITAEANGKKATCTVTVTTEPVVPTQADKDYLKTINGLTKHGTLYAAPHKVLTALKDAGYDVLAYKLSNPAMEFAFDASAKKFIIMYGDEILAKPDEYSMKNKQVVFKFVDEYNSACEYGQYLMDNYVWEDPAETFEFTGSIDVGNNTHIKNMLFKPTASNADGEVLIRTYCEYLDIAENSKTIFHVGESNNINVRGIDKTNICNYMELGRTAYMYAMNTKLQIAKLSGVDVCQIDVLEADENVTKGDLFHPELITVGIGEPIEDVKHVATIEVATAQELGEALSNDEDIFIRLTKSITLDSTTVTTAFTITDRSLFLDLAGNTITDATALTAATSLFDITVNDEDSSVFFIDSERKGSIILNDHYINVLGDYTDKHFANLYLEGANITYKGNTSRRGPIVVGDFNKTTDVRTNQYSRVYMYGGVINANTDSTTHNIESAGIYAANNSYVLVQYGTINSSVNCVRNNGSLGDNVMEIVNADLNIVNENNIGECIYMTGGKLYIHGGNFTGNCCLGIRGGDTVINGGYFHSTGKQVDEEGDTTSGLTSDGSTICVELCDCANATSYGLNPTLTISNATLQSDNSYAVQVFKSQQAATTDGSQFFEADFFDGVYYYAHDPETASEDIYDGMRIATALTTGNYYRINQQGGSWIKTAK